MRAWGLRICSVVMVAGLGLGLAASVAADTRPGQLLPYDDPAAVAAGAALYAEHCAACHGADLSGEPDWPDWRMRKPSGRLPAPPHDETGHTWHHPDAQLLDITTRGTAAIVGNGYESDMTGFAEVLTEEEILQVLGYIKSTWPAPIIARHNAMNAALAGN